VFIVLIAFVRLCFEIFQFIQLIWTLDYIKDLVNWIEVILFVCSILFAFVFFTPCNCPLEWQWQVGVVAMFLAWIDLIFFLGKTPLTGMAININNYFKL
jgi:transient receptor potential cation channel subfamily A protein 1